ncbi:MAG: 4-(cytidine 5'-diphospho)-2-C-methyl-D-erythritol kinase [Synechococcaceae cyanobacterium]|nr:4-(cytidine 5'-diphospho)-2-C-methyl-D-erythritol kinase [Synechococcaceae cyanobacterium]
MSSLPPSPPPLRLLAPAKINLHLEVLGLRPDGFHELAMVMQSLDLADRLELRGRPDGELRLTCDRPGLEVDESNLVLRAGRLLQQWAAQRGRSGLPGVDLQLEKRIPIGAGLAGGSSDAAAALVGLDAFWGLSVPSAELHALAAALGSDVPFCLEGGTRLCFGRGERLEAPASPGAPGFGVLLIKHPEARVSTPWAYGRCRELREDFYLTEEADFEQRRQALRQGGLLQALAGAAPLPPLRNDLQGVVAPEVESVSRGLALLRDADGVLAAAMSGSGPSLFALFADVERAGAALEQLREPLTQAGFEAWCCRCLAAGVGIDQEEAPPPEAALQA